MGDYVQEERRNDIEEPPSHMRLASFLIDIRLFEENWPNEWSRLPQPACKEIINNLPELLIQEKGKECSICLLDYKKHEIVKEMPCRHIFHPLCLITWLNQNNTCPFCRYRLPDGIN